MAKQKNMGFREIQEQLCIEEELVSINQDHRLSRWYALAL